MHLREELAALEHEVRLVRRSVDRLASRLREARHLPHWSPGEDPEVAQGPREGLLVASAVALAAMSLVLASAQRL